jgi:uncharacterized protein YjbI with pentapeptide repeats
LTIVIKALYERFIDMKNINEENKDTLLSFSNKNKHNLRADCESCFGFCCVALYFSASEGFPEDKEAGKPCINLQEDFRCRVHKNLGELGLRGCMAYDCFGAGQRVAQVTYEGRNWRQVTESSKHMYEGFLIMRQIHEMLWYLTEAHKLQPACDVRDEISTMINELEHLTLLSPNALIALDLSSRRDNVNILLRKTSELVRNKFRSGKKAISQGKKTFGRSMDLIGKDLRKADLKGADLRGAYLIAADIRGVDLSGADFIGADLRDADLRGADLTHSIFLTQAQINTAKGNSITKLPKSIEVPMSWVK